MKGIREYPVGIDKNNIPKGNGAAYFSGDFTFVFVGERKCTITTICPTFGGDKDKIEEFMINQYSIAVDRNMVW